MNDKILITGASGWLGKAAIYMLHNELNLEKEDFLLFSSTDKQINVRGNIFNSYGLLDSKLDSFRNFKIGGIIHLAFLTREKVNKVGHENYVSTNRRITEKIEEIIDFFEPKWVTTVSSGAANFNSEDIKKNPYGFLKMKEEEKIFQLSQKYDLNYSIGRLWGAMGYDMPINRNYAISDFICQAIIDKRIRVTADKLVFRRFVADTEFIETCLKSAISGYNDVFDSGGEKIEVRDLASNVANIFGLNDVNSSTPKEDPDNYYPVNEQYADLRARLKLPKPEGLNTLIERTIEGHKSQQLR